MCEKILGMLAGSGIRNLPPPETTNSKPESRSRREKTTYSTDPFPTTTTTKTINLVCGGKTPHLETGRVDSGR